MIEGVLLPVAEVVDHSEVDSSVLVEEQQAVGLNVASPCRQIELKENGLSGGCEVESADWCLKVAIVLEEKVHAVSCWIGAPDCDIEPTIVIRVIFIG